MLNPVSILKGVKVFLILGVISFGLIMVNSFLKDQREVRNSLITANAEKVSAQARAEVFAHANLQLEARIDTQDKLAAATQDSLENLNEDFTAIRIEQARQTVVLEGDRLSRLIDKKQELIKRLSNKATRARFDEVESIFDGS